MKSKYVIIGAVVLAIILIASVAAYTFLSTPTEPIVRITAQAQPSHIHYLTK
jgi:hypothetical protein